jgi:hypothetical protein
MRIGRAGSALVVRSVMCALAIAGTSATPPRKAVAKMAVCNFMVLIILMLHRDI